MAARSGTDPATVPPGSILIVVHDFTARSPDELSLAKGDRIELIERDDDFGDGWFLGKHLINGTTGLFPEVYTRPAPTSLVPPPAAVPQAAQSDKRAVSEDYSARNLGTAISQDRSSAPITGLAPSTLVSPNPVMSETLDVIKEHMNDMNAPQNLQREVSHESDSAYGHADHRTSYIRGQETDEEEESHQHTQVEVSKWSPTRVAEYLEDQGVEKSHCQVFLEQEISGEVLLGMEQSSIFIKEFELGSVGRRLKTWQKVKALQDEVKQAAAQPVRKDTGGYGNTSPLAAMSEAARQRGASVSGTSNYLSPTYASRPIPGQQGRSQTFPSQPVSPASGSESPNSARHESSSRPSAQNIRSMNHSRRHSSISSDVSVTMQRSAPPTSTTPFFGRPMHERTTSGGYDAQNKRSSFYGHKYSLSGSSRLSQAPQDWGLGPMGSPEGASLDRGYFSGNEMDKRGNRRSVLQKKTSASASHSRQASEAGDALQPQSGNTGTTDSQAPINHLGMFKRVAGGRSASSPKTLGPTFTKESDAPTVTKLEFDSPRSPLFGGSETSSAGPSPSANTFSFFNKSRNQGARVASEPVPQSETAKPSPINSPARTGSTTPSTETQSIDHQKSDGTRLSTSSSQNATAPAPGNLLPAPRSRPRARSKKFTSAYTRGLEKKPPVEQIAGADYSGWMKKKSASLVGSWKPRLFVLRGRRLSYYYSETDTEEKGLIDISGHRVLPAENDRVTGLHAQLTGAKSPQSPETLGMAAVQTSAAADLLANPAAPTEGTDAGLFIFKLVPPRQGLSKAVNFTKPTVHYFAVNSRQEGRLWMAALMKATIDYDANGTVTTSYNQPTISLAKAKARRERPPALRELSPDKTSASTATAVGGSAGTSLADTASVDQKRSDSGRGLGIGGLPSGNRDGEDEAQTVSGAEGTASRSASVRINEDHNEDGGVDETLLGSLRRTGAATLVS